MSNQNTDERAGKNYLLREDLPETTFSSRIRDELMVAKDIGKAMINDRANLLPEVFASETSSYAMDVREDLRAMADNDIEGQVAELASYKIKQELRNAGLFALEEDSKNLPIEDEEAEELTGHYIEAFMAVDTLSDTSNMNIGEEMAPYENLDQILKQEQWERLGKEAAENYLGNQLVHDEDWVSYLSGETTRYNEEVRGYLEDIGFSNF